MKTERTGKSVRLKFSLPAFPIMRNLSEHFQAGLSPSENPENYHPTIRACFTGYISQSIVNSYVPLLFLTFERSYNIPLSRITLLITVNFCLQLMIDLASVQFIDRIGYRASIILAHVLTAGGLILLTILPEILPSSFMGLFISVVIYGTGGGLLEVLVSPILEACPTPNKKKAMSLLHAFYSWGVIGVVALSTLFFTLFGIQNWKILTLLWTLVPIFNGIQFTRVPIRTLNRSGEKSMPVSELFRSRLFRLLFLMTLCAGACEQSIGQWASVFAEAGLGVKKSVGDLAGPMLFYAMMGTSQTIFGRHGEKMNLPRYMKLCAILDLCAYFLIGLTPFPLLSFIGCGLCGFGTGIMWPGTFSSASASLPRGGTALFALMALAGDLGSSSGPGLVGLISEISGGNLKTGMLSAAIFPVLLLISLTIEQKEELHLKN